MPRPGKTYPPVLTPREQWIADFEYVVIFEARQLGAGKFLRAVADQQQRQHGTRPAAEVAREWLASRAP